MQPCKNLHVFGIMTHRCIAISSKVLPLHQALTWHAAEYDNRWTPAGPTYMSGESDGRGPVCAALMCFEKLLGALLRHPEMPD